MGASGAGEDGAVSEAREDGAATRVLFVCLGNICRSPTAEGVMRALVARERLEHLVQLESAGTGAWHVGSAPDERAAAAALAHGVTLEGRARQVRPEDFEDFDLLLGMDRDNVRELRRLAADERQRAKVRLLREFDPEGGELDVPDPYYGRADGFEEVFALVQAACEGLLAQIRDGSADSAAP